MDEATWGDDIKSPPIDWRMSAALQNVPRGSDELPEVTNLEGATRDWLKLPSDQRRQAILTPERPLLIAGALHHAFEGDAILTLADLLPAKAAQ